MPAVALAVGGVGVHGMPRDRVVVRASVEPGGLGGAPRQEERHDGPRETTPEEVAGILRCSVKKLANDRSGEGAIPFVRVSGRMIRYRRDVLNRYLAGQTYAKTSQYPRRRPTSADAHGTA